MKHNTDRILSTLIIFFLAISLSSCGAGEGAVKVPAAAAEADSRPSSPGAATMTVTEAATDVNEDTVLPVEYYQFDERWAKLPYDNTENNDTVRRWACGPAAMAMAIAALRDPSVDPAVASAWSLSHGYYTPDINNGKTKDGYFTAFGEEYGLKITQLTDGDLRSMPSGEAAAIHGEAEKAIEGGDWVICLMGEGVWTTAGHYILWYGMDGGDVLIRDSNSKKAYKARNKIETLRETVIRYWVVDVNPE